MLQDDLIFNKLLIYLFFFWMDKKLKQFLWWKNEKESNFSENFDKLLYEECSQFSIDDVKIPILE